MLTTRNVQFEMPEQLLLLYLVERSKLSLTNMAIDDIKLEVGDCPAFSSVNFEDSTYGFWENVVDNRDEFDWEFGSFDTTFPVAQTGPM